MPRREVVLCQALRTAIGSYGGTLKDLTAAELGAAALHRVLESSKLAPASVQSVIMGDSRLWERPLDRDFRDNMIASRNDDLDARVAILKENGNFKNVDTAMPVESLDDLEQYRSDRLTDKVTSLKDSLDAQYKADERGRVFDRPCQVLDDGDLDEH